MSEKKPNPRKASRPVKKRKTGTLPAIAARKDLAKTTVPKPRKPPAPVDAETRHQMIAQAAYFRAEHRGFADGGEFDDWLEAEREIARTLKE